MIMRLMETLDGEEVTALVVQHADIKSGKTLAVCPRTTLPGPEQITNQRKTCSFM
jgi:hypothetical protein